MNSLSSHGSPGCNLPRAFWFTKIENVYCRFNKPTQHTLSKHAATHCNTGVLQTHCNKKSDLTESRIETWRQKGGINQKTRSFLKQSPVFAGLSWKSDPKVQETYSSLLPHFDWLSKEEEAMCQNLCVKVCMCLRVVLLDVIRDFRHAI